MSGEKAAKRQKVSHGSSRPSAPSSSKEKSVEEEPVPSSSDAEESDNEQVEDEVEEEVTKTFKDLVSGLDSFEIQK